MTTTRRPGRPSNVCCVRCRRVFARGHVPDPDTRGRLVCKDCRPLITPAYRPR